MSAPLKGNGCRPGNEASHARIGWHAVPVGDDACSEQGWPVRGTHCSTEYIGRVGEVVPSRRAGEFWDGS